MRLPIVSCALALVAALPAPASADVPPPAGYVERCTVKREQHRGESCLECVGHIGDREACGRTYGPQGFSHRCNSAGVSKWSEIWCKGGNGAASNGGSAHAKGCTVGGDSSSPAWAGALLLLVASLALLRGRRRRR